MMYFAKVLAILLAVGCAGSPRAKTEHEAALNSSECDAKITRAIFEYSGPRSGFCEGVQKAVDELVRSNDACAATYADQPKPDICSRVRAKDGGA